MGKSWAQLLRRASGPAPGEPRDWRAAAGPGGRAPGIGGRAPRGPAPGAVCEWGRRRGRGPAARPRLYGAFCARRGHGPGAAGRAVAAGPRAERSGTGGAHRLPRPSGARRERSRGEDRIAWHGAVIGFSKFFKPPSARHGSAGRGANPLSRNPKPRRRGSAAGRGAASAAPPPPPRDPARSRREPSPPVVLLRLGKLSPGKRRRRRAAGAEAAAAEPRSAAALRALPMPLGRRAARL